MKESRVAETKNNMNKYTKDYSAKTAKEWLACKKWTAFLMSVPLGKPMGYPCADSNYLMRIRVTASMLNNDPKCDRTFKITADFDTKVVTVTADKKQNQ